MGNITIIYFKKCVFGFPDINVHGEQSTHCELNLGYGIVYAARLVFFFSLFSFPPLLAGMTEEIFCTKIKM